MPEGDVNGVVLERRKTMEAQTVHTSDMAWEATTRFPGTAEIKVLRHEGDRKARTLLVRLGAGGRVTPHSHIGTVQHYVLEGEYEAEGKIYGVGTFRLFHEHADIPEITTRKGATILMIYDPVA
jgi:hypothetical protein